MKLALFKSGREKAKAPAQYLGIDMGGTNVKMAVVTREGEMSDKVKYATADLRADGRFIPHFLEAVDRELKQNPLVKQVGIGVPGTLNKERTTLLELPNIPELSGVHLKADLENAFPGVRFYLENDANAAALGELYFSGDLLPDSYLFITLGTGVGGAAIIDGTIFKGGNGNALEIGHIMSSGGKTVEQKAGKKGMVKSIEKILSSNRSSVLKSIDELTAKDIVKAAHRGDEAALKLFSDVGAVVGEAIVAGVRILDVHLVLIGGGVSETFDYIKDSMMQVIEENLTPYYLNGLEVRVAKLGNNAGILGAASLCIYSEQHTI